MILLVAPLTGVLVRYVSARLLVAAGLVLLALAFLALARVCGSNSYLALVPGMVLGGTGAALTIPLNAIAIESVHPSRAGVASGIFKTARETGGCVGVALTSAVVSFGEHSSGNSSSATHAFSGGYRDAMLVAAVLTMATAAVTLLALRPGQEAEPTVVLSPRDRSTEWEMASTNAPTI